MIDGHTTVTALAAATGTQARGIRKLLRVLAHEKLFTLGADDTVGLTALGSVLVEDHVHERYDHRSGYARIDDCWPGLLHSLRTGGSGYEHATGRAFWARLGSDDKLGSTFDHAQGQESALWSARSVEAFALTGEEHMVDVGGGTGTFLAVVLDAHPGTRGTLVELPTTAERARHSLGERGLADRVRVVPQSFFEPLPPDGDVYVLAQVLHDWPDAEAVAILTRVAEAAGDRRILLVERLPSEHDHDHDLAYDLQMYARFGGGGRDLDEYAALAERAGLHLHGVTELRAGRHLLELRPRG